MRKIGITGGIGSGKSYVCQILEARGIPVFYCDDEARKEIAENKEIHKALRMLVGDNVFDLHENLVRPVLASYICRGKEYAARVNSIVHPKVLLRLANWFERQRGEIAVVECALLFEAGFDKSVDVSVVVVSPIALRIERVMKRDSTTKEKVEQWMSLQRDEKSSISRANFVLYNDKDHSLPLQIEELIRL